MKSLTLLAFSCLLFFFTAKSQNLLNLTETQIVNHLKYEQADYQGKIYSQDSVPIMRFSYNKPGLNSSIGILSSYYMLDDNNKCYMIKMLYKSLEYEDSEVALFKNDRGFEKLPDKFGWIRKYRTYV